MPRITKKLVTSEIQYGYLAGLRKLGAECPAVGESVRIIDSDGQVFNKSMHNDQRQKGRIDGMTELYRKHEPKTGDLVIVETRPNERDTLRIYFGAGDAESGSDGEDEDEDQTFAAEADLRDFLANNLACVESGLHLYQPDGKRAVEFRVDDGWIDILAVDQAERFVVFELKLARGRNKALGQILYYMGWVDKHLGKSPCRGIIVAKEITEDLKLAVQRVQGITLYRYKLSVSVEKVS